MSKLNILEEAVYQSDSQIGKSFYLGLDSDYSNISNIGDVLARNGDKWSFVGPLIGKNGLIGHPLLKKKIDTILKGIEDDNLVTAAVEEGATFECILESDVGISSTNSIAELPDAINGILTVKSHITKPNAYSIQCKGSWKSLQDIVELQGALKDMKTNEKLAIYIRNPDIDYALVTAIFTISGNFAVFTANGDASDFKVKLDGLTTPLPIAVAYNQLADGIKQQSPNSELKTNTTSFVPFVRLAAIKPMWNVNGELQDKAVLVEGDHRGAPPARMGKVVKAPDDICLEPNLKLR